MSKKPDQNKQIKVDYKIYQKLEEEAKENDETIKEVVESYVINEEEKESEEQNGNWERVDKERVVDKFQEIDGFGKQKAWKTAMKLMATDWWRIQFNEKIYKEWNE